MGFVAGILQMGVLTESWLLVTVVVLVDVVVLMFDSVDIAAVIVIVEVAVDAVVVAPTAT